MADPAVIDILYESLNDDGKFRGVDRAGNCLRCIRLGNDPIRQPTEDYYAFCQQCMDELDMSEGVKKQMFRMRRQVAKY